MAAQMATVFSNLSHNIYLLTSVKGLPPTFDFASGKFIPYIKTITWASLKPRIIEANKILKDAGVEVVASIAFCW
jgi:hypothetical protein